MARDEPAPEAIEKAEGGLERGTAAEPAPPTRRLPRLRATYAAPTPFPRDTHIVVKTRLSVHDQFTIVWRESA